MAIDEAILTVFAKGSGTPTLRFFGWRPACLSLGYFQQARSEVDLETCRQQGVDVVRRPTGGRAVLHDREVTYSLVASAADPRVSGGVVESYRKISAGLVAGLSLLGVEAEVAPPKKRSPGLPTDLSAACFDSTAGYELSVKGRKLVGSAQMRREGAILQHGAILLDFDPQALFRLLLLSDTGSRARRAALFSQHAVALGTVLGRQVDYAEVVQAMVSGFASALDLPLEPMPLSPEETELANRLRVEKYNNPQWNFCR
jgi:lipoate-protein ligase A